MTTAFNKEASIEERLACRRRLMRPFLRQYGSPVIVHAVHSKDVFKKILAQGTIKLPRGHKTGKKCPHLEKVLGLHNTVFYSLGFVYYAGHGFRYNLLFDAGVLKDCEYYRKSVVYQCYKAIANYWYEQDRPYLEALARVSPACDQVVRNYLRQKHNGKARVLFDFWKIEDALFRHLLRYKKKAKVLGIVSDEKERLRLRYPASARHAKKVCLSDVAPEVISRKQNNLRANPHFIGFFIGGKIPRDVRAILERKYPTKMLYDGKRFRLVAERKVR